MNKASESKGIVGRAKRGLINLGLVCVSGIISIVAVELLLHTTDYKNYISVTTSERLRFYYEKSPEMGFDINPKYDRGMFKFTGGEHEVFSNAYGCFDRDDPVSNDYILLVGDSFTWGYTPFEKKWGTEIERRLKRRVLKCGVEGTGTHYQTLKAKKIVRLTGKPPQYIVVGYYMNDFSNDVVFPSKTVVDGRLVYTIKRFHLDTGVVEFYSDDELQRRYSNYQEPKSLKIFLRDNSVLANMIWGLLRGTKIQELLEDIQNVNDLDFYDMEESTWLNQAWSRHLESVREFKRFAETQGSQLVFVFIPNAAGERPQKMVEFLQASNIEYIDLYSDFVKSGEEMAELYWAIDGHLNEKGNLLTGAIVADYLKRRLEDGRDFTQ